MNVYKFLKNPTTDIYFLPHITFDCETTNKSYGSSVVKDNRVVVTGAYRSDTNKTQLIHGGMAALASFIEQLELFEGFLVGQNIKFDLRWMQRYGLDLSKVVVWDTMIAEHVFYGNRPSSIPLHLGAIAKRYGFQGKEPFIDLCMQGGVCPSDMPTSLLERRVLYDVGVTEYIFRAQLQRAIEEDKLKTILTRCLFTPVLADIEQNGICLDADVVNREYSRAIHEKLEIQSALKEIADINWNSSKQRNELVYGELGFKELVHPRTKEPIRTEKGQQKSDVATLQQLTARTKKQKELQDLLKRHSIIEAQLSKTLSKFKDCIDNGDLLYAQFNQAITQTHRLSSSGTEYGVQFQNMPRIFKPCAKARIEGWHVMEADGAQLEFRVAAFLGQDEQAIYDILNGVDVHQRTADTITAAGQPTTRQEAKARTFLPLFGGRSGTEAEKAYNEEFKTRYSGVAKTQELWKIKAIKDKCLTIPSGLTFYFPNISAPRGKDGYIAEESNIFNYPIQSLATADIIPISVVYMWHEMKHQKLESFLINTVHDSVVGEIKPEEMEKINEIALQSFGNSCYNYLNTIYNIQFNVPLGCGIKIGSHWGTGKETSYTLETPYRN